MLSTWATDSDSCLAIEPSTTVPGCVGGNGVEVGRGVEVGGGVEVGSGIDVDVGNGVGVGNCMGVAVGCSWGTAVGACGTAAGNGTHAAKTNALSTTKNK
jgi:NDP-sugar pyrophosphorylase family protein